MAAITGHGIGGTINPYEQLAKNLNKQGSVSNTVQNSVQAGRASSNPGFAFGMGMGAQSANNGGGLPGFSGTSSRSAASSAAGGSYSKTVSSSPSGGTTRSTGSTAGGSYSKTVSSSPSGGSTRSAGSQTTYYDPQGNKQTGWIIDGQTYKDQNGNNRVDVGSQVQTGNGWYELGQNGGVKIDGPTWGSGNSTSSGSTGGSTSGNSNYGGGNSSGGSTGSYTPVDYYIGNQKYTGYIGEDGRTYTSAGGGQRVPNGAVVVTKNGTYVMDNGAGKPYTGTPGTAAPGELGGAPKPVSGVIDGENVTLYIINNHAYLDRYGTLPIPNGAMVQTGGGWFQMTNAGGRPVSPTDVWNAQQTQAQKNMFAQRQQSMIDAVNAGTEAGVLGYEQMLPGINAQYDTAAKQAYSNYMLEKQDMPEQMARLGLGGQGVTESTAAKMANTYQGNLNESELARRAAIQQVNNNIAKLRADAQAQIAQGKFDLGGEEFDAYKWLQELMMQGNQFDASLNWEKEQYKQNTATSEYERQLAIAEQLAQYGDFSGYKALGIDTTQMEKDWKRQQEMDAYQVYSSGRSSGGSGSKGSSGSKSDSGKMSYSKMLADIKSADDPYQRYNELLSTHDISSADANNLKKALDGMFDEDMADIVAGRVTYESIRDDPDGRFNTNRMRLMYGDEGYQELLDAAFENYKKRKGIQ